jgi:hypothetical protein
MGGYCEPKSSNSTVDNFHGNKWVSDMEKSNHTYGEGYYKVKKKFNLSKMEDPNAPPP